jgi:hypothetical protein
MGEMKENDFFGLDMGRDSYQFSVVATKKVDILLIPRDEIIRFATEKTWNLLLDAFNKVNLEEIGDSYEKQLNWLNTKKAILADSVCSNGAV